VSEIARSFAHTNVTNNRHQIRSQILATIRPTIRRDSHSTFCCDDAVIVRSIRAPDLSSWLLQITRPSRLNCEAVLGGVNALRCAPTVRFRTACGR
jgi:hypothetical protein